MRSHDFVSSVDVYREYNSKNICFKNYLKIIDNNLITYEKPF